MTEETRKYYPLYDGAKSDAVVVHCSDPRFQDAFRMFIKETLGIVHPAPIILPGSVSSVGLDFAMPKHLKVLKDNVETMISMGKEPRLVLINHEECKAYQKVSGLLKQAVHLQQLSDLKAAAIFFKKFVPAVAHIEVYMAKLDRSRPDENKVYFEKIL